MKRSSYYILPIFFLVITSSLCLSQTRGDESDYKVFEINHIKGGVELGQYVYSYEDNTNKSEINDILSLDDSVWQASSKTVPNAGYTNSSIWYRLTIKVLSGETNSNEPYILVVENLRMNILEFYEFESGAWKKSDYGSSLAFNKRPVDYRYPAIIIHPEKEEMTCYFKIKSDYSLAFPLKLWRNNEFENSRLTESLSFGIYYGILLIMIIYNLVIFITTRDSTFLYYVLYMSFFFMANLSLTGYTNQYLWPGNPYWAERNVLFFFLLFTGAFVLQFCRKFLDIKDNIPPADKVAFWIVVPCIIFAFLNILFPSPLLSQISIYLILFIAVFLMYVGTATALKRFRPAYYFLIAWSFFIFSVIVLALESIGLLPVNSFTENAIYFGSAIEAGLISLAMADRINLLKKEKAIAQQRLIEMMDRDQEIDDMVSVVSHDLKSPINQIRGLLNLFRAENSNLDKDDLTYLDLINKTTDNLLVRIRRLLDVNALESKQIDLNPEITDIGECLSTVAESFAILAKNNLIRLTVETKMNKYFAVLDKNFLIHIYENILSHTIKHNEQNKEVILKNYVEGKYIYTDIVDDGPGISEEEIKTLYNIPQTLSGMTSGG
ncbi:MAG: sensor histidine kinase, partial [Cyclobacteriaceae bacterium]|nr:sensor histidine kinase [Cyclobacteriaceae bacterium]